MTCKHKKAMPIKLQETLQMSPLPMQPIEPKSSYEVSPHCQGLSDEIKSALAIQLKQPIKAICVQPSQVKSTSAVSKDFMEGFGLGVWVSCLVVLAVVVGLVIMTGGKK